jgi:hypothetical protein
MRSIIAFFVCTLLATVMVAVGIAVWNSRLGNHDPALRVIHYDTNYDLSSQRRLPADWNRQLER